MTENRARELLKKNEDKYSFYGMNFDGRRSTYEIILFRQATKSTNNVIQYIYYTKKEFLQLTDEEFIKRITPVSRTNPENTTQDELAGELMNKLLDREEKFQEVTKLDREIKELTQEMLRRR